MNMRKDKTDELFRKRLADYEWTGDIPEWEEIETHLSQPVAPRVSFWRYGIAATLVAATCGWLGIFISRNPVSEELITQVSDISTVISSEDLFDSYTSDASNKSSDKDIVSDFNQKDKSRIARNIYIKENTESEVEVLETVDAACNKEQYSDKDTRMEQSLSLKAGQSRNYVPRNNPTSYSIKKRHTYKKDYSIGLLSSNLAFGAKKGNNVSPISYSSYRPIQMASDFDGRLRNGFDKNRLSGFNHRLPVKVGVNGSYGLSNLFSIETGLVYSYHYSDFTRMDGASVKGVQKLHFIGLPVNILCHFAEYDGFRVYGGAGGEINVNLHTKQRIEFSGKHIRSDYRQREPVFGAGIKLGTALRLFGNLELYLEPALMKYWSKGDLHMRWTDDKLTFNLNIGIRTLF